MFDTHIHTCNSGDSKQTIDEICLTAIKKGLKCITITDHVDIEFTPEERNITCFLGSAKDASEAKKVYGDRIKVFFGTELAMPHASPDKAKKLCSLADMDIILGSVHLVRYKGRKIHLSDDDLSESAVSKEDIIGILDQYYDDIVAAAETADIDVLCHITYPFRYTNGKYNRGIDANLYSEKITRALKAIIKRNIALEVNTAKLGTAYNYTSPTFDIVEEYFNLGGRMITIGSDAHSPEFLANGFDYVKNELKKIGFTEYYYFEKRKPIAVKL